MTEPKKLTREQERGIRKAAEKFARDLKKGGMTVEDVTRDERGVPTIHVHLDHGEKPR